MAQRIPPEWITELIQRTDIVTVIGARVALKKRADNHFGNCPFHQEKTASFSVSAQKQFFYCFGCHAGGNVIEFLMRYERYAFLEAVEELAQLAGMAMPGKRRQDPLKQVMEQACRYYREQLSQAPQAQDYLHTRGINQATLERYEIGWAPANWHNLKRHAQIHAETLLLKAGLLNKNERGNIYDRFRGRVMFPVRNEQRELVGFGARTLADEQPKYLNSPQTPLFHKKNVLYGLPQAKESIHERKRCIVTEGYMDVIALAQFGFLEAVATLGTAVTEQQCQRLLALSNRVYFCFDGDQAGALASERALQTCLPLLNLGSEVYFVYMPQGEDPDSVLRKGQAAAFEDLMNQAQELEQVLLEPVQRARSRSERYDCMRVLAERMDQVGNRARQQALTERLRVLTGETPLLRAVAPLAQQTKRAERSLIAKAVQALLLKPDLAQAPSCIEEIDPQTGPGHRLLHDLYHAIQTLAIQNLGPSPSCAQVLQHFSQKPEAKYLNILLSGKYDLNHAEFAELLAYVLREQLVNEKIALSQHHVAEGSQAALRIIEIDKRLSQLMPHRGH